jgi:hypothetical protein
VLQQCDVMIELLLPEKFLYDHVAPLQNRMGCVFDKERWLHIRQKVEEMEAA